MFQPWLSDLRSAVGDPDQVRDRELDRYALAHDASHFLLLPAAVATPRDAGEVAGLLQSSARHGVPLTLRSGGTSLSGQAVTDGLLVDVGWREVALAALVLLVVRPLVAALALRGGPGTRAERAAIAFFGVRGIGSVYYLAYALGSTSFDDQAVLYGTVTLVIMGSVLLHGLSAGPVMSRLDRNRERQPAET